MAGEPGACLAVPGNTQGITYLDLSLDASSLPQPLLPLVPVFQRTLMRLGTRSRSLERLSQDEDLLTGGITSSRLNGLRDVEDEDAFRCAALDVGPAAHRVTFRTKALSHNAAAAADLLRDVVTDGHLDQKARVCDILKEMRSKCEASAVSAGACGSNSATPAQSGAWHHVLAPSDRFPRPRALAGGLVAGVAVR